MAFDTKLVSHPSIKRSVVAAGEIRIRRGRRQLQSKFAEPGPSVGPDVAVRKLLEFANSFCEADEAMLAREPATLAVERVLSEGHPVSYLIEAALEPSEAAGLGPPKSPTGCLGSDT